VLQVLTADFSRYDVTAVTLAGFIRGDLDYLRGETLVAAIDHTFPGVFDLNVTGGTMAMAKAMNGNADYSTPSTYATPLVVEGFLNFGVLGTVVFLGLLGIIVGSLDHLAETSGAIGYLFALVVALKLPFGVSTEISAARLLWAVGVPFAVLWLMRTLLGGSAWSRRGRMPITRHSAWQSFEGR
jgi:hypothetical protein